MGETVDAVHTNHALTATTPKPNAIIREGQGATADGAYGQGPTKVGGILQRRGRRDVLHDTTNARPEGNSEGPP